MLGGGTANIPFLMNQGPPQDTIGSLRGPNAQAIRMTATFWIETVQRTLTIPPFKPGNPPLRLATTTGMPDALAPHINVDPGREITTERVITLQFTQIQYTQTVFLNFNGLSWPHVSVATLVSSAVHTIPPAGWP